MDPDPRGLKTYGSCGSVFGSGFGSASLPNIEELLNLTQNMQDKSEKFFIII
jgi:hypothetical protein